MNKIFIVVNIVKMYTKTMKRNNRRNSRPHRRSGYSREENPSEKFCRTKQQDDHDYKKRYDDLKKHYDAKLDEFKTEREQLARKKLLNKGHSNA